MIFFSQILWEMTLPRKRRHTTMRKRRALANILQKKPRPFKWMKVLIVVENGATITAFTGAPCAHGDNREERCKSTTAPATVRKWWDHATFGEGAPTQCVVQVGRPAVNKIAIVSVGSECRFSYATTLRTQKYGGYFLWQNARSFWQRLWCWRWCCLL